MNVRKPISKTARFEVFKRDGFICQYCGSHPPQAILHVDHINPVKLGGDNKTDNLITSCSLCNLGKSATPLTAVPKSLAERAAEIQEREFQIAGYTAVMDAERQRIEDDAWRVAECLSAGASKGYSTDNLNSIKHFVKRLGLHGVLDSCDYANSKYPWSENKAFRYFCGICWRKIREADGE